MDIKLLKKSNSKFIAEHNIKCQFGEPYFASIDDTSSINGFLWLTFYRKQGTF